MPTSDNDIMTIQQAATFLSRPACSLYEGARLGKIPAKKIGKRWTFSRTALEQFLGQQASPTLRLDPADVERIADAVIRRFQSALGGNSTTQSNRNMVGS